EVRTIGDVVILDLHYPRFGPFAVFAELDLGIHDRADGMRAQIVGDLAVVEALGGLDSLLQHLKIGIAPAAEIIAEWVDATAWRLRLVFFEEIRGRRHQFGRRHPEL